MAFMAQREMGNDKGFTQTQMIYVVLTEKLQAVYQQVEGALEFLEAVDKLLLCGWLCSKC